MSRTRHDAIVIGAGHNGLIAAAYLARAGLDVLVVEARSTVGGCSSTETFAGCRVNICNCDHITFRTTPVMEELGLHDLGLRYIDIDPNQVNVPWNGGPAWALFRSVEQTLDALSHSYPSQVKAYRRYCEEAIPIARLVLAAAASGPRKFDLLSPVLSRGGAGAIRLLRWSKMSAADVMRSYFDDENLITPAMATGPIVWGLSPELPGTGLGALTYAFRHVASVGRPEGGSGRLAEVLAKRLHLSGGSIRTSSPVASIVIEGSRVRGVTLESGEEIRSDLVVSAADPKRTFLQWLKNPPRGVGRTIERWRRNPHQEGYESKIDAIVKRLPVYKQVDYSLFENLGANPHGVSTMITPSLAEMDASYVAMGRGEIAERPVMFANVPTFHDPSMAPAERNSQQPAEHVFSLETLFTPYSLAEGWTDTREPRRWLELHDTLLADGLYHDIGLWRAMTPATYETEFFLPSGHATSFAGGPLAAFRGKPRELTRYRTPVDGLYLCGAATFPGAGIWGASGRHCAREILGAL